MEAVLGLESLRADLAELQPQDQVLAIDLRNRDPDAVFSEVPYQKGRLFLTTWTRNSAASASMPSCAGISIILPSRASPPNNSPTTLRRICWNAFPASSAAREVDAWVHDPGLPADAVLPVSSAFQPVDAARAAWLAGTLPAKKFGARLGDAAVAAFPGRHARRP